MECIYAFCSGLFSLHIYRHFKVKVGDLSRRPSRMRRRDMNCVADVLASVMDERFGAIQGSDGEDSENDQQFSSDDESWSMSD